MTTNRRRNQRTNNIDQELEEERAAAEAERRRQEQKGGTTGDAGTTADNVKRLKLGWKIRVDLKKACQQIALDSDMKDYEVLEMLLDEALAARAGEKVEM